MSKILIVTWDGGGNVPPALGLAAELVRRRHDVVVLGHPGQREAFTALGATVEAYRTAPPWDPRQQRHPIAFGWDYLALFTDRRFGRETADAIERHDPDVVVVDVLLPAAMAASIAGRRPTVVLVHTVFSAVDSMARGPIGRLAALKGVSFGRSIAAADAVVIASPEALAVQPAPARSTYVGPVFGSHERVSVESDPDSRRVLVSLSTIAYPGMRDVLQSLVGAFDGMPLEAIVTTGPTIDPAEVRAPGNVTLRRSAPHADVLPDVGLVIGHGGHGTATKALSAGVPVLIRPLSPFADHVAVAQGLEHARVGGRISRRLAGDELRTRILSVFEDADLRARARSVGRDLRGMDGAALGADVVERARDRSPAASRGPSGTPR